MTINPIVIPLALTLFASLLCWAFDEQTNVDSDDCIGIFVCTTAVVWFEFFLCYYLAH